MAARATTRSTRKTGLVGDESNIVRDDSANTIFSTSELQEFVGRVEDFVL
jgi:hypothetical protein